MKYHLGASSDREFDGNTVHLSLTANPSHLEIVDPVVLGKARAKQDQRGDKPSAPAVLPLLHPRRRGLRRPGRGGRMLRAFGPQRPPHRRLHPFHRQQPDRLHHQPASCRAPRPTPPTSPRWSRRRSSTSTATTRKPWSLPPRSPPNSARSSTSPWSSTCSATAASATTKATSRSFTQPLMYKRDRRPTKPSSSSMPSGSIAEGVITDGEIRGHEGRLSQDAWTSEFEAGKATRPTRPTGWMAAGPACKSARTMDDARRGQTGVDARRRSRTSARS